MAIVQNPIIGRASGKFGTAIFQTLFGQNILRTLPVEVRQSDSPALAQHRLKFAVAIAFVKSIYSFVKNAFPVNVARMSPSSFVMASVMDSVEGTGITTKVDAKKALEAFKPTIVTPAVFTIGTNLVTLDWTVTDIWPDAAEGDIIDILLINVDQDTVHMTTATLPVALDIDTTFVLADTTVADEVVMYAGNRSITKFKAGAELANAVG